jgi:hypothetical protein
VARALEESLVLLLPVEPRRSARLEPEPLESLALLRREARLSPPLCVLEDDSSPRGSLDDALEESFESSMDIMLVAACASNACMDSGAELDELIAVAEDDGPGSWIPASRELRLLEESPELLPEELSEPTIDSMVDAAWASRAAIDSGLKVALSLDPPEVVDVDDVDDEVETVAPVDPVDCAAASSAAKLFWETDEMLMGGLPMQYVYQT